MSHPFSPSPNGPEQTSGAAGEPFAPYPRSPSPQIDPSPDSFPPPPGGYFPPFQQGPYGQPGGYDPQGTRGYPPAPRYAPQPFLSPSDEKLWSTLSHLSIPFVGVIGPLVVYLLFKDRGPFVRVNAVESLNFSILYSIAQFVSILLTVVIIGSILVPIVGIAAIVLCILAALAAHRGEAYKYPVNYPFVR